MLRAGELGKEIKRVEEEVPNVLPEKRPEEAPAPVTPEREREKEKVPVKFRSQLDAYSYCVGRLLR